MKEGSKAHKARHVEKNRAYNLHYVKLGMCPLFVGNSVNTGAFRLAPQQWSMRVTPIYLFYSLFSLSYSIYTLC